MPTYQYRCKSCENDLEIVQRFTDDPLTECPACEDGELRKVFNAVGVVFKGSGFYRTDSRKNGAGGANGGSSSKPAEASAKPSGGGDATSSAKKDPAKTPSTNASSAS